MPTREHSNLDTLKLPTDLTAFLTAGKQLEYDASDCEVGSVNLLPLSALGLELFPMDCQSTPVERRDPNHGSVGCYLVPGVSLLASAVGYEPDGLLLWLSQEERFGSWDSSHAVVSLFQKSMTWTEFVRHPAECFNAMWGNFEELECLEPWHRYRFYHEQLYWSLVPVTHPLTDSFHWFQIVSYLAIFHRENGRYSGKVVGFPVREAAATLEEVKRKLRLDLTQRILQLLDDNQPVPEPRAANESDGPIDERDSIPIALIPQYICQ